MSEKNVKNTNPKRIGGRCRPGEVGKMMRNAIEELRNPNGCNDIPNECNDIPLPRPLTGSGSVTNKKKQGGVEMKNNAKNDIFYNPIFEDEKCRREKTQKQLEDSAKQEIIRSVFSNYLKVREQLFKDKYDSGNIVGEYERYPEIYNFLCTAMEKLPVGHNLDLVLTITQKGKKKGKSIESKTKPTRLSEFISNKKTISREKGMEHICIQFKPVAFEGNSEKGPYLTDERYALDKKTKHMGFTDQLIFANNKDFEKLQEELERANPIGGVGTVRVVRKCPVCRMLIDDGIEL